MVEDLDPTASVNFFVRVIILPLSVLIYVRSMNKATRLVISTTHTMLSSNQEQSSASCPPLLPRLIWYLLVDSETGEPYTGQPYKGAGIDVVSLSPDSVIDQF